MDSAEATLAVAVEKASEMVFPKRLGAVLR